MYCWSLAPLVSVSHVAKANNTFHSIVVLVDHLEKHRKRHNEKSWLLYSRAHVKNKETLKHIFSHTDNVWLKPLFVYTNYSRIIPPFSSQACIYQIVLSFCEHNVPKFFLFTDLIQNRHKQCLFTKTHRKPEMTRRYPRNYRVPLLHMQRHPDTKEMPLSLA